jgi:signal transduction histidine kinase
MIRIQIHKINVQLKERNNTKAHQPITLDLFDKEISLMAANVNRCLENEYKMALNVKEEEKNFQELIANISHDLRTPVTAVKGYLQLAERISLPDEAGEHVRTALKHTEKLAERINQFFQYSYYISNNEKVSLENINLTNLVTDVIIEFIPVYEEKHKKVIFDLVKPIKVNADPLLLTRVIQNLLRNSLNYSDGDVYIDIISDDGIIISVRNLVEESADIDVDRLFERLYTVDKTGTISTGLGLTIVKLLVEKMNGKVSANLQGRMLSIIINLA